MKMINFIPLIIAGKMTFLYSIIDGCSHIFFFISMNLCKKISHWKSQCPNFFTISVSIIITFVVTTVVNATMKALIRLSVTISNYVEGETGTIYFNDQFSNSVECYSHHIRIAFSLRH